MSARPGRFWVGSRVKILPKVCGRPHVPFKGLTSILTGKPDRHRRRRVSSVGRCMDGPIRVRYLTDWFAMKRAFDFVVSALGLIVLMPLMLIIAYRVSRSSPGGVLFVQP